MEFLGSVNWEDVLTLQQPLAETLVRGTLVYLALFALLRLVLNRQSGNIGVTDVLVVVLIADAAQNAMAADYKSVPDGILLVSVILFWDYVLDWAGFRFPAIGRFIHPPPLPLVVNGRLQHRNMRRELITRDELMTQLRTQGIESVESVKKACMEGNGSISVVKYDEEQHAPPSRKTVG